MLGIVFFKDHPGGIGATGNLRKGMAADKKKASEL